MKQLESSVAVVTGAGSGIGAALAAALAARGATVVVADVDGDAAARTAATLGPQHLAVTLDVADPQAFLALASQVERDLGGAQVLVNNAGVAGPGGSTVWTATADDWSWVLGVNLLGVVNGLRAFMPQLLAAEQAGRVCHVVTTASLSGLLVFPYSGPYTASKHAGVALSEQVAAELRAQGSTIGVTVVCPAWVRTGIVDSHRLAPAGDLTPPPASDQLAMLREAMTAHGLDPAVVADSVLDAMTAGTLTVLPLEMADEVVHRAERLARLEATYLPGGAA
jgi:NAD(P)-dependent dehydrogenase (short-subunit alcohol dehydrogenase family)